MLNKLMADIKDFKYFSILIILVLFSRIFFFESEKSFNSIDAVNYYQAVKNYSLIDERPHLPGYYLYVKSIDFIDNYINNIHLSTKFLSILFTLLSTIFLFRSFRKFYDSETAFSTSLLILFLPTVIYYSSVSESYISDFFFGILIFYLGNSKKASFFIPIAIAVSMGFRQTSALLLLPLSFYLLYSNWKEKNLSLKSILISIAISLIIFLLWFIPMTENIGGITNYIQLWKTHNPTTNFGFIKNIVGFSSNMLFVFLPISIIILFMITNKTITKFHNKISKRLLFGLLFWCMPAVILFSTYHYAKGYILVCVVGIYFLIAEIIDKKLISKIQVLSLLTVFISFYYFCPTIEKKVELHFSNNEFSLSKVEKFNNRLLTYYMPVYDNIKINNHRTNSILSIFDNLSENNSIFADPSLDFRPELINLILPNKKLYAFNIDRKGKMTYFFELYRQEIDFKSDIIEQSMIIGNKDFVLNYLNKSVSIIGIYGEFAVYSILNTEVVLDKYGYFF